MQEHQACMRRAFVEGQQLMSLGQTGAMFVILEGHLRVTRGHRDLRDPFVLGVLGPGDVVGDMGAPGGAPRHTTLTAASDVVVAELSGRVLGEFVSGEFASGEFVSAEHRFDAVRAEYAQVIGG